MEEFVMDDSTMISPSQIPALTKEQKAYREIMIARLEAKYFLNGSKQNAG